MNWFNSLSLRNRILSIVAFGIILCATISIAAFIYFNQQELYRGVISKSNAIHARLDAATFFVGTQNGLDPVIERMKLKYKSHSEMTKEDKEDVLKQVPIVAAMKIGAKDAEKDDYEFRIFSDAARNEGNQASVEELKIFKLFETDKNLKEHIINDGHQITVYKPVRLYKEQGCFKCHGDPATSPWGDGRDILGYTMENWSDGKLHGVFAIKTNLDQVIATEKSKHIIQPDAVLILGIIGSGLFGLFLAVFLLRKPIKDLNDITTYLEKSGNDVNKTASKIAETSEEFSQASTEQASSLQETSASIEEISKMISSNTENANFSSKVSVQSLDTAEKGKQVVNHMIDAIGDINNSNQGIMSQIDETNKEIEKIVHIINEIGNKTKVINDIVFQTKLLSFNASVEAARAGEHGKGFSVVAEEVGNLANMSGKAAQEITQMLESSIRTVENIAKDSKEKIGVLLAASKTKVESGVSIAKESEQVLHEIVDSVASVTKMISDISHASNEQAQGVQEINKAVAQLDQVTQQNTQGAAHAANAASELAHEAEQLNSLVQKLKSLIDGAK